MGPDMPTSPVIASRRLRAALRHAREVTVTTQAEAAKQLGWSVSKIQRIESGAVAVGVADVRAMSGLYRLGPEIEARLVALGTAAAVRGWWWELRHHLPAAYQTYVGLEWGAATITLFEMIVMPGLFQTPRYTMGINNALATLDTNAPEWRAASVTTRRARQEGVLNRQMPPQVYALLDESVVHRVIGDRHTMCDQLRWLVELTRRPNVEIRIRPFVAGLPAFIDSFALLSFDDDPDVGYVESAMSDALIEDGLYISTARAAFAHMWNEALSPAQTRSLLRQRADDYAAEELAPTRIADNIGHRLTRPAAPRSGSVGVVEGEHPGGVHNEDLVEPVP